MSGPPSSQLEPATARPLADEETRRRIRSDLGTTLIIEAAAGTGKTTELVARMLAVLRSGAGALTSVAAVTFTEKAAGEMKLRLRAAIEKARTDDDTPPDERARLEAALAHLEVARIGTIHSLCADLLRERPVEAGVDPLFEVVAEDQAQRLFDEAFDRWLSRTLMAPGEGVRRMLRRRARSRSGGPRAVLRDAAYRLAGQRDFDGAWRRDPFDRVRAMDELVDDLLPRLASYSGRADRKDDFLAECVERVSRFLDDLRHVERVRARDHDALEADLGAMARWWEWNKDGRGARYGRGVDRQDVLSAKRAAKAALDEFAERAGADLAACLQAELWPVLGEYEVLKRRAGALDFHDLLLFARDLVRGDAAVRAELQRRMTHLFVDEFQDTDPLQAEILLLLAADDPGDCDWTRARPIPGKLFLVGDPKQSIYRFRRADVALYQATKTRLLAHGGAALLYLTTSFRGAPGIQQAVNAAFAPRMQGGAQADYVPLESFRPEPDGRPTVIALPAPAPYGSWGRIQKKEIEACFPDAVGGFVDFLVNHSGWTVTERERPERPVPIEARHVCLLFKRFQSYGSDVTRPYVRALETRRIPHVLVGGRSYHDREEVLALRNALCSIEWPDDELRVYATLHGPLFSFSDDELLAFKGSVGTLHPLRPLERDSLPEPVREIADALRILAALHAGRNTRPIADTVARLLEATRAHAGFAIWPTGEQALANVLRVMDLGRRFEASGATSFRAFVERLEDEASQNLAADAPVVEEGTEGVRIMTVHRAKGLEFPVVILVDPTAPARHDNPSRWVDPDKRIWAEPLAGLVPVELCEHRDEVLARDDEEAVRVAYVAATRARDLLVVPTVGDERVDGWLSVLHPAVYPPQVKRRASEPAAGCPKFGLDSVRAWPVRAPRDPTSSVAPGLHRPEAGAHQVVWWDPNVLDLERDGDVGLRQQRILAADESLLVSDRGEKAHAEWQARRRALLERGATPTLRVRSVTELGAAAAESGGASGPPVEHFEAGREDRRARPHGKRFGTLVHALLAEVDLDADPAELSRVGAMVGRLLGATREETDAAVRAAGAALTHPLLRRASASDKLGQCRREAPVMLRLPDGTLAEGVVDLAFRESDPAAGARWTVVDFKTDVELARDPIAYQTQVRLYAEAITAATGEPASGALLSV